MKTTMFTMYRIQENERQELVSEREDSRDPKTKIVEEAK